MTDQEIEKLREKLGSEYSVKRQNGAITVELVDIWKGVEFAEVTAKSNGFVTEGKIYRIYAPSISSMLIVNDQGESGGIIHKSSAKPSTEAAYVEQLKAKAYELYGEIKDGDRFDSRHLKNGLSGSDELYDIEQWYYEKETDTLYSAPEGFGGFIIYREGKWAKKLSKCIVMPVEIYSAEPDIVGDQVISIQMKIIHGHISQKNRVCVAYHLAKCLEDFLNKSQ